VGDGQRPIVADEQYPHRLACLPGKEIAGCQGPGIHQQDVVGSIDHRNVGVPENDDLCPGCPAPFRQAAQYGVPGVAPVGPVLGRIGMVAVPQQHPLPGDRGQLLVGQLPLGRPRVVVAVDRYDRGNRAEPIQDPQLPHVTRVQDQIDSLQHLERGCGQGSAALGHVRVRDEAHTGHNLLGRDRRKEQTTRCFHTGILL